MHFFDGLQPNAVLLLLDSDTLEIAHISANCQDWLGLSPQNVLYKSLFDLFVKSDVQLLQNALQKGQPLSSLTPLQFQLQHSAVAPLFYGIAHHNGQYLVLELQFPPVAAETPHLLQQALQFTEHLQQGHSLDEMLQLSAYFWLQHQDFEHIQFYIFHNFGEIESRPPFSREGISPVSLPLDLKPKELQVIRHFYQKCPLHWVEKLNYQAVELKGDMDEKALAQLDLSQAQCVGLPPILRQQWLSYNQGSVLSLALYKDRILWGLALLQHTQGQQLSYSQRLLLQQQAQVLSLQLGYLQDLQSWLTDRQQAALFSESESRFQSLFDGSSEAMLLFEPDSHKVFAANQHAQELFGYAKTQLQHMDYQDLHAASAHQMLKKLLQQTDKADKQRLEVEVKHAKGYLLIVEVTAKTIKFGGQDIICLAYQDLSERKQLEASLNKSNKTAFSSHQNLLRTLQRNQLQLENAQRIARIGSWEYELPQGTSHWSEEMFELLDVPKNIATNSLYTCFFQRIHPNERQQVVEAFKQALQGEKQHYHNEFRILRRNGDMVQIYMVGEVFNDLEGKPKTLICTLQDISHLYQIRQIRQHMLDILENAKDFIGSLDRNGKIVYLNQAGREMIGFGLQEDLSSLGVEAYHPPEEAQKILQEALPAVREHGFWQGETYFLRRDGQCFPASQTLFSTLGDDGEPAFISTIARDISETQKNQEALRRSEERLKHSQAIGHIGNWEWNILTNELYWSDEIYHIFGVHPQQFEATYPAFLDCLHPEDQKAVETAMNLAIENRQTYQIEHRVIRPNKTERIVLEQGEVFYEAGRPVRMLGLVQDITERKQIELDLERAKLAAESANHAKSVFIASISHELRTPLNAVLGYAQLLMRDTQLKQKQQDSLQIIHNSGQYLLELINEILDLSKIEAGHMELLPQPCMLNVFLQKLHDIFALRAREKGIDFQFSTRSILPDQILADEKRLRQIFTNLLSNAVKFTECGHVHLKLDYNQNTQRLQIMVEDTGIGMSETDLKQIFNPFTQVGASQYKAQGTGLGLAITQKLINLMSGELRVLSKPQCGSIFWTELNLPSLAYTLPQPAVQLDTQQIMGYQRTDQRQHPFHILIVDDVPENRQLLEQLLNEQGFVTRLAANGQIALDIAQTWQADMVLMDLVMPVMDGFVATRHLRKLATYATVPIIAVSASAFDSHRQQSLAAGCQTHVSKPISECLLLSLLQQYLPLRWQLRSRNFSEKKLAAVPDATTPALPMKTIQCLEDYARRGKILEIQKYAKKLVNLEAPYSANAKYLQTLAEHLDMRAIREFLKQQEAQH